MPFLYHIRRDINEGDLSKGYIGITVEPKARLNRHLREGNAHLMNAFAKYDDINMQILYEGDEEFCLLAEQELRPTPNIGWNIAVGGGKPPSFNELSASAKLLKSRKQSIAQKGRVFTEEHKKNMQQSAKKRGVTTEVMDKINISKAGGFYFYKGKKYPTASSLSKVTGYSAYRILKHTKLNETWKGISFTKIGDVDEFFE